MRGRLGRGGKAEGSKVRMRQENEEHEGVLRRFRGGEKEGEKEVREGMRWRRKL